MKISVIAVGKLKELFYKEAAAEYEKRLSRYCKTEIIQVEDESTPDKASQVQENSIREKEADRILRHVKENAFLITLEIEGESCDSIAFAKKIQSLTISGKDHIQFVIGGSLGLHEKICRRADLALSFSKMTFPHQLMRVILLEQIYRAFRIINGEPYHK